MSLVVMTYRYNIKNVTHAGPVYSIPGLFFEILR